MKEGQWGTVSRDGSLQLIIINEENNCPPEKGEKLTKNEEPVGLGIPATTTWSDCNSVEIGISITINENIQPSCHCHTPETTTPHLLLITYLVIKFSIRPCVMSDR